MAFLKVIIKRWVGSSAEPDKYWEPKVVFFQEAHARVEESTQEVCVVIPPSAKVGISSSHGYKSLNFAVVFVKTQPFVKEELVFKVSLYTRVIH